MHNTRYDAGGLDKATDGVVRHITYMPLSTLQ